MAKITADQVKSLRDKTGISMMECKKALTETDGNVEKAIEFLRKRGEKVAAKRAGTEANEGLIHSYIHPGARLGVLLEIRCETDFSANTDDMKQFAHNICMQIAAAKPLGLKAEDISSELVEKELEISREPLKASGKPEQLIEKIAENKLNKFYENTCLLQQKYIKNDKISIQDYLNEMIAKIGENIQIKRFIKFELGK